MNQRTFLTALGVGICLVVAGCVTPLGENQSNDLRCSLEHEIVDDRNRVDTVERRYAYANLSSSGKSVFDNSLATNGSTYSVENDSTAVPAEFEYTDTLTYYEIERDTDVYVMATWSSEGCSVYGLYRPGSS